MTWNGPVLGVSVSVTLPVDNCTRWANIPQLPALCKRCPKCVAWACDDMGSKTPSISFQKGMCVH